MAFKADPYADIDFDDITEATGLAADEIKCLKVWKLELVQNIQCVICQRLYM